MTQTLVTETLKSLSNDSLLSETKKLIARERELTTQVLRCLCEIENRRIYLELGYSSLFIFCVRHFGFTESQTQRRIVAMRTMREIPAIEDKIKDGKLSLTAVAQAQSYFRQNNIPVEKKVECLKLLENKSTRECEKELAALAKLALPLDLPKEKKRQVTETHSQWVINIPNALREKLEKIQSLLGHKNSMLTQAGLLDEMAEICLDKLDLERRKIRIHKPVSQNLQRSVSTAPQVISSSQEILAAQKTLIPQSTRTIPSKRVYLPIHIKKLIWQKYKSSCSFEGSGGRRCGSTFKLEIDHVIPLSLGGSNDIENLRLLCSSHNKWEARKKLGDQVMRKYWT